MPQDASRQTVRGVASRGRIVDAAATVMFESGVAGTSLDDVLALSGTSKSQLYHYFRDKDDLVRAVVRHQAEVVMKAHLPEGEALESIAALRRWRQRVVAMTESIGCVGGCPVGSLANELAESDEETRSVVQASIEEWEGELAAGLAVMKLRGRLRPEADPAALAEALMAALQGGLLLSKVQRNSRPLARALDMAIEHVRRYTP
jgi:TetR/AcrR family transcriptional repressor of nem operon